MGLDDKSTGHMRLYISLQGNKDSALKQQFQSSKSLLRWQNSLLKVISMILCIIKKLIAALQADYIYYTLFGYMALHLQFLT